jgi:Ran GTPase-activating protein (RanGAP) involved in mRNA processing and transport
VLAKLPQLTEIRLMYGKLHDGRVLGKALGQLEHLKNAYLSLIAVEPHGVRHILSGLQSCAKLEDLSISFPSKYQDEFLTTFKKFTALKCLRVTKNCIEGRNWTGGIPGYDGTNIINRQFVNMLPELSVLESLKLWFMDIDNDGVYALATVLPLCTRLKKLDLRYNRFTGAGVDGLVPVVLQCPKLEWVGLKSPYIDDMSDETKEAMRTSKVRFSRKSDVWKSDGEFEVELSDEEDDW